MDIPIDIERFRSSAKAAIKEHFVNLVENAKKKRGSLAEVARQLGVQRQMLYQYADGSVPATDVLIAALLLWRWEIRIEGFDDIGGWCEFSLTSADRLPKRKPDAVQLSLFDALSDLDQNLETLKKSVGRVEIEIARNLPKRA